MIIRWKGGKVEKMKTKFFTYKIITFTIIFALIIGIVINIKMKRTKVIKTSSKIEIKNSKIKVIINKSELIKKELQINKQQGNLEKKWKIGYDQFFEKKYAKAIETEGEVLKEDDSFYKAYAVKGIALAYNGNFKEGMRQIDKALELKPNYGYAIFNKALANELYGFYDEAIKWYKKDLEVEKSEWSYYGIASIYGRKGDINNTTKYLKLAIAINENIKSVAENEEDFNNVKKYKEFKLLISK